MNVAASIDPTMEEGGLEGWGSAGGVERGREKGRTQQR